MSLLNFDEATTAGRYCLTWNTTLTLPSTYAWIENWNTTPSLQTAVNRRQNFWSTEVVLDGRYPAMAWEHNFRVYCEVNTYTSPHQALFDFYSKFTQVSTAIDGTARNLRITVAGTTTVKVDFGAVYLENFSLEEPEAFMFHRAGFINLQFVGTSIPSVV